MKKIQRRRRRRRRRRLRRCMNMALVAAKRPDVACAPNMVGPPISN